MDLEQFRLRTICGVPGTPSPGFIDTGANNVYLNLQTYYTWMLVPEVIAAEYIDRELSAQELKGEISAQTLPYLRREYTRGIEQLQQGIATAAWLKVHPRITDYERRVAPRRLLAKAASVDCQLRTTEEFIQTLDRLVRAVKK